MKAVSLSSDTTEGYLGKRIAILIPCFNEEVTIKKVINDFQNQIPSAVIYVYDNNSSDNTAEIARREGALVVREKRQGKGYVIASMFKNIESDIYILVDGDDTYPANKVNELILPILEEKADMVIANRLINYTDQSFRKFHLLGNFLVIKLVNILFHTKLNDIMSGYRAFNKSFVKGIPVISRGFEVETQLTLQALHYDYVITEILINYGERPEGSYSKLNTMLDGFKVVMTIFDIFKAYRPLLFFFIIGLILLVIGIVIGSIPLIEFVKTGKITKITSAIVAASIMTTSIISISIGIILDSINHRLRELIRIIS